MDDIERRDFLKYLGLCAAGVCFFGCSRREDALAEQDAVRNARPLAARAPRQIVIPQHQYAAAPQTVPTVNAASSAARASRTSLSAAISRNRTGASSKGVSAVSRAYWHASAPQTARMTRMGGYDRVTVHHEGNATPNYDNCAEAVACSLRRIQSAHCKVMKAGDIGYHFIIDRQGMIWQGRELCYQGAHVKSNNSNNIGIMCLGNFDLQQPTQAQVNTLARLCQSLMQGYHIPASKLYAHRELRSTACPGKNLYPQVLNIRKQIKIV